MNKYNVYCMKILTYGFPTNHISKINAAPIEAPTPEGAVRLGMHWYKDNCMIIVNCIEGDDSFIIYEKNGDAKLKSIHGLVTIKDLIDLMEDRYEKDHN